MESALNSSSEELSPQEKLMLSSSKRQEPQGEEHDTSSKGAEDSNESGSSTSSKCSSVCEENGILKDCPRYYYPSKSNNTSMDSSTHSAYNTLIIHQNNASLLADTWIPASHEFTSVGMGSNRAQQQLSRSPPKDKPCSSHSTPNSPMSSYHLEDTNSSLYPGNTSSALSEIPRDCLDQLTVLKHLAKEVQDTAGPCNSSLLHSASFSKSQPDLTQTPENATTHADSEARDKKKKHASSHSNSSKSSGNGHAAPATHHNGPSVQILEILMRENANLKAELLVARRKICSIQKLEAELNRLQASHAALFESTERRESLERTARTKLSTEVKRLTAVNRELLSSSNSLQNLSPFALSSDVELLKKEVTKKELAIAQLVSQNKELIATKERQDIELAAQRATLTEQRNHIDILDRALNNAQANVYRLEEESRKKEDYAVKVSQLQRALSSLQLTNEKREQSEKKMRNQLEAEVTDLKLQLASTNASSNTVNQPKNVLPVNANMTPGRNINNAAPQPPPYPGGQQNNNTSVLSIQARTQKEIQSLQEKLKSSEEKIAFLSAQVARWEQLFASTANDKAGYSNANVSSPNTPTSWTSRGGTPMFFGSTSSSGLPDDVSTSNPSQDYEWKMKDLESQLYEKEAVIRMLCMQNLPPGVNLFPHVRTPNAQATIPPQAYSPFHSSSSCETPVGLPSYRESPCYSAASSKVNAGGPLRSMNHGDLNLNEPIYYPKIDKCDSEPPSYANLPIKLRLGGSGSSLIKNSNESLQSGSGASVSAHASNGSGQASPSAGSNKSEKQTIVPNIDEQLKELNNQLSSKDVDGSLKVQSTLCCIPGFTNPSSAARKGKVPQSLLESLNRLSSTNTSSEEAAAARNPYTGVSSLPKNPLLPPLPMPKSPMTLINFMPSAHQAEKSSLSPQPRTSSGPPFISPGRSLAASPDSNNFSINMALANSVDSIGIDRKIDEARVNVFTPVSPTPTGLPPKIPSDGNVLMPTANKCRSLERNNPTSNYGAGKYTVMNSNATRCKSLDRRDLKAQHEQHKPEEKPEKKGKSGVSSKAAFFGQLLTRRSPSPSRNKEKEKLLAGGDTSTNTLKLSKFSFSSGGKTFDAEQDLDAAFLDKQGRSSQRNRVPKWTISSSNLEAVQELEPGSSPWTQRRSAEVVDVGKEKSLRDSPQRMGFKNGIPNVAPPDSKKWGKIVKTPFGLRYTFGGSKNSEGSGGSKKSLDEHIRNNNGF